MAGYPQQPPVAPPSINCIRQSTPHDKYSTRVPPLYLLIILHVLQLDDQQQLPVLCFLSCYEAACCRRRELLLTDLCKSREVC